MEMDFMGLSCKNSEIAVKKEGVAVEESCKGNSWITANKVPLKPEQEGKPSLMMSKFLEPCGNGMKLSGADMLEANHKRLPVDLQQDIAIAAVKQRFLGGGNPHPILAGTAEELLINSKISDQLTIFYAGTVSVFDGISPEKAHAVMLLAGNYRVSSNMVQSKIHVQASKHKPPSGGNQAVVNQSMNMPLCSGLPSPMSVSSHPVDQSAKCSDNDKVASFGAVMNKVEPARMVPSAGSAALTAMMTSAVPQSRKASLARFLKKRNERVLSAAPYNLIKKETDAPEPTQVALAGWEDAIHDN